MRVLRKNRRPSPENASSGNNGGFSSNEINYRGPIPISKRPESVTDHMNGRAASKLSNKPNSTDENVISNLSENSYSSKIAKAPTKLAPSKNMRFAPQSGVVPSSNPAPILSPPASPPAGPPPVNYSDSDDYDDAEGDVEDMAIRVVVRKRPISKRELANGDRDVMEVLPGGKVFVHEPKTKVDLTKVIETSNFFFDDAFEADETNELIYKRTIKHLVNFVFEGGKASCFAYGQTGSGKTFSMMGCSPESPAEAKVNAGLYVLAARDIFRIIDLPDYKNLKVYASCFEIYGGKLFDLLNDRGLVRCLEDAKQQVQLPGLTEHLVTCVEDVLDLMATAHSQRSTGSTGANAESSRSHQVMQIVLRSGPKRKDGAVFGKLSFIDLAGSERGADTTHNSKQTRMEGAEINTSLLALKEVIRSLERKHGHTPFRGSKLTQVLKDSFVGDRSRTCMIACVSPSHSNCEHTLNTLRYADRVKEHQSSSSGIQSDAVKVSNANYDSMSYEAPKAVKSENRSVARPNSAKNSGFSGIASPNREKIAKGGERPVSAKIRPPVSSQNNRPISSRGLPPTHSSNKEEVLSRRALSRIQVPESRRRSLSESRTPVSDDDADIVSRSEKVRGAVKDRRKSLPRSQSAYISSKEDISNFRQNRSDESSYEERREFNQRSKSERDDPKSGSNQTSQRRRSLTFEDEEEESNDERFRTAIEFDDEEERLRMEYLEDSQPEDLYEEEQSNDINNLESTELIQKTLSLLSAHKSSIAGMVEVN